MGATESQPLSSLTPAEVALLSSSTHYSDEEIVQLHQQFSFDIGGPAVSASVFAAFLATAGVLDPVVPALLFRGFDADRDGIITFTELVRGLSAMTRGTNDERIRFAFRMYDEQGTGVVGRDSLIANLRALRRAFGPLHPYHGPHIDDGADEDELVSIAMHGLRDALTYEDFDLYVQSHPSCVRGLALQVG